MKFSNLDYLGSVFGFTYDDSIRLQTSCGGLLSSILTILSITIIAIMGTSLFDKSNPTLIQEIKKYANSPEVNFTNRFDIALRMTSPENVYTNLDKIRIKLVKNLVYKSNYDNISFTDIPLSQCDETKFADTTDFYRKYRLDESLCPDMTNSIVDGDFLSDYYTFFQIKFSMCINDPKTGKSNDGANIICKSEEDIKQYLQRNLIKAQLFFTDTSYDTENFLNPEVNYINNYNINVFFNTQRETNFHLYYSNLTSDDTIFFLSQSVRNYINVALSYISERNAAREPHMNDFVIINIDADKISQNLNRSYKGFAETAANIGAIVNIVFLIFNISTFIYSRTEFFNRLIKNTTYMYSKKRNFKNLLKKKSLKMEFSDKIIKKVEESKVDLTVTNVNQLVTETKLIVKTTLQLEVIRNRKAEIEKKLSITSISKQNGVIEEKFDDWNLLKYNHDKNYFEMIIISFCPFFKFCNSKLRRDITFTDYSMKHYYKYTDFFNFFESFIELDLLKKLILNKEETEVLNILKRIIFVNNDELIGPIKEYNEIVKMNNKNKLMTQGSIENSQEKLRQYIHCILTKKTRSVFDQNLLNHFDEILKV